MQIIRLDNATSDAMLAIVNGAAEAYRDTIPADLWHQPYLTAQDLVREIAAGVVFWGCEVDGRLQGIVGLQSVRDADLIRHAYVAPDSQRRGIGAALIAHLQPTFRPKTLVGTWAAATWAIAFYRRNGFALTTPEHGRTLLGTYWSISPRQTDTSVVLCYQPA